MTKAPELSNDLHSESSWKKSGFIKGFIGGTVVLIGFIAASLFRSNFMIEPDPKSYDLIASCMSGCIVPLISIGLVSSYVNKILPTFGFDKVHWHGKSGGFTFAHVVGFLMALAIVFVTIMLVGMGITIVNDAVLAGLDDFSKNMVHTLGLGSVMVVLTYIIVRWSD